MMIASIVAAIVAVVCYFYLIDPSIDLKWAYPFALLAMGYRNHTLDAWSQFAAVDSRIIFQPNAVPEIQYQDFNYEVVRKASSNFRFPVVIRGIFKNSTAILKWKDPQYLSEVLGPFQIPIVKDGRVGTLQNDRQLVSFASAYSNMVAAPYSKEYIFFPVKSRFTFAGSSEGSDENLQTAVNRVVAADLNLDKIWPGFGGSRHRTFGGAQFIIGKSTEEFGRNTTGSDWHCAAGNNWFVQVTGKKRWDFISPKYSAYMWPLKGGMFNMWTGNPNMVTAQQHIPSARTILEEGDLLYNPDWTWHKVTNFGGLSIGVPIRERNMTLGIRNNPIFMSIVVSNFLSAMLSAKTGLDLNVGGFPDAITSSMEQDN